MTLRSEAMRATVLGALKDLIDGEYQHARGETLKALLSAREEMGAKSVEVALPDGTKVAGLTLIGGEDQVVVADRAAFTEWVRHRAPDRVSDEPSPRLKVAQALSAEMKYIGVNLSPTAAVNAAATVLGVLGIDSRTPDPKVDPKYETQILDEVKPVKGDAPEGREHEVVLPSTGEIVPGVKYRPAGDPTSFQMRYKKGGRDAIAEAWQAHELDGIEGLPEIAS